MNKNIYFILSIITVAFYSLNVEGKIYTTYSCEGHTLKLSCYFGHEIKIIKADYGRWNATVCQYLDYLEEESEMNLNCHSNYAEDIIKAKCNNHRTCKIKVDNEHLLEDPCPGQVKYAEAKYMCVNKPNTRNNNYKEQNRATFEDELTMKGFNALINMANNYNNKKHKYNEVQPAYKPNFKTQFNVYNSHPHNGTAGSNIFK